MKFFIDFSTGSLNKAGEELCGDKVEFHRSQDSVIAVLSDGLGSGVKANILATLTSKIAITMLKEGLPIEEVVDTIVQTLPVCKVRKLAYSTFTIVKINDDGNVYVVEFGNPGVFFIRNGRVQKLVSTIIKINDREIEESRFHLEEGDTLVLISDGVVHAGIGTVLNLGWGWEEVAGFIEKAADKEASSMSITSSLINVSQALYAEKPGDDATVVVLRAMKPNWITLFAGPPQDSSQDRVLVEKLFDRKGKKIVCGGTAANIVARELNEEVETSFEFLDKSIPPTAIIKGIDLVTEGVLTLKAAVEGLEIIKQGTDLKFFNEKHGAAQLARMLVEDCTHLRMLVGRAINPAHQNPDFPEELSIKLHIANKLQRVLLELGKVVEIEYF